MLKKKYILISRVEALRIAFEIIEKVKRDRIFVALQEAKIGSI